MHQTLYRVHRLRTMKTAFIIKILYSFFVVGIQEATALNCTNCFSMIGWDDCKNHSEALPCSIAVVNDIHSELVEFNPTLQSLPETTANVSFQCFAIELESNRARPTGETDRGYVSGCTFKQQKVCGGWTNETRLIRCASCETVDICSGARHGLTAGSWVMLVMGVIAFMNVGVSRMLNGLCLII
ncbi:uncharacterized protein LOC134219424 [Armigeres subalbatus]|uniref:uncharacterized protein LOC134219424 n=1 Tax=Armigeres subalbatus TaxID=124917 RepID=UPI002ED0F784